MKKCIPFTIDSTVGGQLCHVMFLYPGGSLDIDTATICGQPYWEYGLWWIDLRYGARRRLRSYGRTAHALESSFHEQQIFPFSSQNHEILSALVREQNLVEYLKLIGVEDSAAVAADYREDAELGDDD